MGNKKHWIENAYSGEMLSEIQKHLNDGMVSGNEAKNIYGGGIKQEDQVHPLVKTRH